MSRFVAAGTDGQPTEQDEKWLAAQQAIEATRSKPKIEPGQQEGGKSLYETLQANKGNFAHFSSPLSCCCYFAIRLTSQDER